MVKLLGAIAAIVLSTSPLATAAPRQGATGKLVRAAVSKSTKAAKPAKRTVAKATTTQRTTPVRRPLPARTTTANAAAPEAKATIVKEHDLKAEELEIKRLKSNIKAAEQAGDWQRASRDRRAMYQLEADVRADKADSQDQLRAARNTKKKSRIPFWGWWR